MISADWANIFEIERVMLDPEIYDRTNPDGTKPLAECDIFKAELDDYYFIGGYVDGGIASLYVVKDDHMHFWVLEGFRKYARELLEASMTLWPYPVYCEIPSLYPEVINFAKNEGFAQTSVKKDSWMKNGKLYDVVRLEWAA